MMIQNIQQQHVFPETVSMKGVESQQCDPEHEMAFHSLLYTVEKTEI